MSTTIPASLEAMLDPAHDPEGHLPQHESLLTPKQASQFFRGVQSRAEVAPALREEYDRWKDTERKRKARARMKRAVEFDGAEDVTTPANPQRMRAGMVILTPLHRLLVIMTTARYGKVRRVLGDTSIQDVVSMTFLGCAEGIARQSDHDLVHLLRDSNWLATQPGIPDLDNDDPEGARFLIRLMARQVRIKMADHYRSNAVYGVEYDIDEAGNRTARRVDRTLLSLEYLDTVLANSGGVDELIERTRANRTPHYTSKEPGLDIKRMVARVAVETGIAQRDLSWLMDIIDANLRTNGSFMWKANYQRIWDEIRERTRTEDGAYTVPLLPETWADKGKADSVRRFVRALCAFLPALVAQAYNIVADPVLLNQRTHGRHLPTSELVIAPGSEPEVPDTHRPVEGVPRMAETFAAVENGEKFVPASAWDDENPEMIRLHEPPDASEWKKIVKIAPSAMACKHGQRTKVVGLVKKAHKRPRSWNGDFCSLDKGDTNACPPVFNGKEAAVKVQHVINTATPVTAMEAVRALEEALA